MNSKQRSSNIILRDFVGIKLIIIKVNEVVNNYIKAAFHGVGIIRIITLHLLVILLH